MEVNTVADCTVLSTGHWELRSIIWIEYVDVCNSLMNFKFKCNDKSLYCKNRA